MGTDNLSYGVNFPELKNTIEREITMNTSLRHVITVIFIIMFMQLPLSSQTFSFELPEKKPLNLKPLSKISFSDLNEASGLVKSRLWENVFWTLNDSGDEARIFPISSIGEILKPEWMKDYRGIQIPDAVNVDWESIATDDQGHLIIADCGNNSNARRDLALYIIKEPYPWETVTTRVYRKIHFYYPEQKNFPSTVKNFDAEAIYWRHGKVYLFTKNRGDNQSSLYEIDLKSGEEDIAAKLMGKFNTAGRVTGTDIHPDGKELIVLTEKSIWLFEVDKENQAFFEGKIYWLPITMPQCEAICFDDDRILLLNEPGDLYEISKKQFELIKE